MRTPTRQDRELAAADAVRKAFQAGGETELKALATQAGAPPLQMCVGSCDELGRPAGGQGCVTAGSIWPACHMLRRGVPKSAIAATALDCDPLKTFEQQPQPRLLPAQGPRLLQAPTQCSRD